MNVEMTAAEAARGQRYVKIIRRTTRTLTWLGYASIVVMVLIISLNVLTRSVLRSPIPGTVEIAQLLNVLLIFSVLAFTESERGNIIVDLVFSKYSRRTQAIVASVCSAIGVAFFGVLAWQGWVLMFADIRPILQTTNILSIPLAPFVFFIALGCMILALEMLVHVFQPLPPESPRKEK